MKKILFSIVILCQIPILKAQDVEDAVRFGLNNLDGTARFVSLGGAFTALGGDMSALKVNPAGSAVFNLSQATFSLGNTDYKNSTEYTTSITDYHNNKFDLNQAGVVFVMNNINSNSAVSRVSLGISYDRNNTYSNKFHAIGSSNETIGDYFLGMAQGFQLKTFDSDNIDDRYDALGSVGVDAQTAYLGYEAYLFDPLSDNPNEDQYESNVWGNSFENYYSLTERGSSGKLVFNAGMAIQDNLFLGLNLNSHFIDYRRMTQYDEGVNDPDSPIYEIQYDTELDTQGTGFSFQLGGIGKINDIFRVGLSWDSPTWLSIEDKTVQFLDSFSDDFDTQPLAPNVVNIFPKYRVRTPGKLNAGLAAVIGEEGLLSFDYSYTDFSNIKFSSSWLDPINEDVKSELKEVNTYSIGGEYRIKALSLRGGFRYQDSPYIDKVVGNLRSYSGGLGYDFGGFKLDLAYNFAQRDYNLPLVETGFSNRAKINADYSNFILSMVFNF